MKVKIKTNKTNKKNKKKNKKGGSNSSSNTFVSAKNNLTSNSTSNQYLLATEEIPSPKSTRRTVRFREGPNNIRIMSNNNNRSKISKKYPKSKLGLSTNRNLTRLSVPNTYPEAKMTLKTLQPSKNTNLQAKERALTQLTKYPDRQFTNLSNNYSEVNTSNEAFKKALRNEYRKTNEPFVKTQNSQSFWTQYSKRPGAITREGEGLGFKRGLAIRKVNKEKAEELQREIKIINDNYESFLKEYEEKYNSEIKWDKLSEYTEDLKQIILNYCVLIKEKIFSAIGNIRGFVQSVFENSYHILTHILGNIGGMVLSFFKTSYGAIVWIYNKRGEIQTYILDCVETARANVEYGVEVINQKIHEYLETISATVDSVRQSLSVSIGNGIDDGILLLEDVSLKASEIYDESSTFFGRVTRTLGYQARTGATAVKDYIFEAGKWVYPYIVEGGRILLSGLGIAFKWSIKSAVSLGFALAETAAKMAVLGIFLIIQVPPLLEYILGKCIQTYEYFTGNTIIPQQQPQQQPAQPATTRVPLPIFQPLPLPPKPVYLPKPPPKPPIPPPRIGLRPPPRAGVGRTWLPPQQQPGQPQHTNNIRRYAYYLPGKEVEKRKTRLINGDRVKMYHKTDSEAAGSILKYKLFFRAERGGFFGCGIYFCSNPNSTHNKANADVSKNQTLIETEVLVGKIKKKQNKTYTGFKYGDIICDGYDTIRGMSLLDDEYVVFCLDQVCNFKEYMEEKGKWGYADPKGKNFKKKKRAFGSKNYLYS